MAISAFSFPAPGMDESHDGAVVACLDGTPHARAVAQVAANYARRLDLPLVFFHAIEFEPARSRLPDPLEWHLQRATARKYLAGIRDTLKAPAPDPAFAVAEGAWPHALADWLDDRPDAMVVIGTPTRAGTGQLVARLLEEGAGRLLVVPDHYVPPASDTPRIALPVDGSRFADSAIAQAVALARSWSGELLLLHVMPGAGIDAFGPPADSDLELEALVDRRNERAAGSFLETTLRRLRDSGVPAHSRCLKGDPRSRLVAQLAQDAPELIILSARGQGVAACRDLALGSTAAYLLDHLDIPVMLVAAGTEAKASGTAGFAAGAHRTAAIRGPLNSSPVAA